MSYSKSVDHQTMKANFSSSSPW